MICIYHSRDADGWSSGAIIKKKFPQATLIGYDYGQEFPFDKIPAGEEVIMVDVSLKLPEMKKLAAHCFLTWVDHHLLIINEYKEHVSKHGEFLKEAVLNNEYSACMGAWKYCFPYEEPPMWVYLLSEFDIHNINSMFGWNELILPFQYGMKQICDSPETFPDYVFNMISKEDKNLDKIIKAGKCIIQYQNQISETHAKKAFFEGKFEGLNAICLNTSEVGSDAFNAVYDESKHDIMIRFHYEKNQWIFSLYTTKANVDCSVIATKYKGGGHVHASGFQLEFIQPFFDSIITEELHV